MSIICFGSKCQYVPLDQNVNKLLLLDENISNFLLDLNISMFLFNYFVRSKILFHLRIKYNFKVNFRKFLSLQT